jgi:hypothetical protein
LEEEEAQFLRVRATTFTMAKNYNDILRAAVLTIKDAEDTKAVAEARRLKVFVALE